MTCHLCQIIRRTGWLAAIALIFILCTNYPVQANDEQRFIAGNPSAISATDDFWVGWNHPWAGYGQDFGSNAWGHAGVTDSGWTYETYQDTQGFTDIAIDAAFPGNGNGSLRVTADLIGKHPNKSQGEIHIDIKNHLPLLWPVPGMPRSVDLNNKKVRYSIFLPSGSTGSLSAPNGVQLFLKTCDGNGNCKSFYSLWQNIEPGWENTWKLLEYDIDNSGPAAFREEGFDASQVNLIGIKVAIGSDSTATLNGSIYVDNFELGTSPSIVWDFNQPELQTDFQAIGSLAGNALSVTRVFVLCDGRSAPEFGPDGSVTGFDRHFYADLDELVRIAEGQGKKLILVLLDFSWCYQKSEVNGVQLGGHSIIMRNAAIRQTFLDNALIPLIQRYGNNPSIFSWEIINEPEWVMQGVPDSSEFTPTDGIPDPVTTIEMQDFVRECTKAIHKYATQPVTVGSARRKWLKNGLWSGLGLDLYQFHWYDKFKADEPFPWQPYSEMGLDKPCIIGEVPSYSTKHSAYKYMESAKNAGYAGLLLWSYRAGDDFSYLRAALDKSIIVIPVDQEGAGSAVTENSSSPDHVGYAVSNVTSGDSPYGVAVFSFKPNGITISEAGVPASPPTTSARIFIDYRFGVLGVPGRSDSGAVNINTGFGIVNCGSDTAHITYTLLDTNGTAITTGQGILAVGNHLASFINQLNEVASGFVLPGNFQFASLDIDSDQPLSVVALRMTTNQRGDDLFTTTPVADRNQPLANSPIYFPQFADGSGWTTSLILLNTSSSREEGSLDIFDNSGASLVVPSVGGKAAASFRYSIPPGGVFRFQTDGSSQGQKAGWVRLIPDSANSTPVGSGVFSYNPTNVLLTESGIPSALSTTHVRIFVDLTENHNTGLAIANLDAAGANIAIQAFQTDGISPIGSNQESLTLTGLGHDSKFVNQFLSGLPGDFTGVLDISAPTPFAAITVRSLINERGDFLMTTFPVADATRIAPSPIVFPQIANGAGYVTQVIAVSPGKASSTIFNFYCNDGRPLAVAKAIEENLETAIP
jgi:hypothetical protein